MSWIIVYLHMLGMVLSPKALHVLRKMIKNFSNPGNSRICLFLGHFLLCLEALIKYITSMVRFPEPSPCCLVRVVSFWCAGYSLGRNFSLFILELTDSLKPHTLSIKSNQSYWEQRLGYISKTPEIYFDILGRVPKVLLATPWVCTNPL